MSGLHSRIEGIWWSRSEPPLLLRLLEPLYHCISSRNLNRRARQTVEPPLPLISVGNITAGGSGKTPFVIWLAHALKAEGYSPVILCRGDGGKNAMPTLIDKQADPAVVGDEARLLADLSGCPVIAAKDRIAGSQMAKGMGDIIILDDGFQYRHLKRSCDIVLVPGEGVGNGHLIPAGPLREPIEALVRADIVIRTGDAAELEQPSPLSTGGEWHWQSKATELIDLMNSGAELPSSVYAVTAIARPQRFFDSLTTSGFELSGTKSFPDHHCFSQQEVDAMLHQPNVAVTGKDAVKLAPNWPKGRPLWLLKLEGIGPPGLIKAILKNLKIRP
ncbi:lipid-A-disaccharide kinase [Mariprofundus aestuarium]|uniref:Tetraacyldisaccharide 4'-kinase n=1 Tax=Mariprofundus aestuarium TaxID=1921086 RepID=A0A2K8KWA6_MARES|nr:tetraacyldisaccharide 4'-kinase [Mariprofundus aestuarium]ATX79093.1 lipid-A-disaccharide kinase [Mariprofundus aestuarium]